MPEEEWVKTRADGRTVKFTSVLRRSGVDFTESVDFFQPTTQPTTCNVLYDFRVVWQSPRSCKLL
jgi:hypothetical protein